MVCLGQGCGPLEISKLGENFETVVEYSGRYVGHHMTGGRRPSFPLALQFCTETVWLCVCRVRKIKPEVEKSDDHTR